MDINELNVGTTVLYNHNNKIRLGTINKIRYDNEMTIIVTYCTTLYYNVHMFPDNIIKIVTKENNPEHFI